MSNWTKFTQEQLSRLIEKGPSFMDDPSEKPCPNCSGMVRVYWHEGQRPTGPTLISYLWCSTCKHYSGSTALAPASLKLADPLSPSDRRAIQNNPDLFFGRLDALWTSGALPQHFCT